MVVHVRFFRTDFLLRSALNRPPNARSIPRTNVTTEGVMKKGSLYPKRDGSILSERFVEWIRLTFTDHVTSHTQT
jgi:hypothetical protein